MSLKRKIKALIIVLTVFTALITIVFIFLFERFAMPVALQLAKENCITRVNTSINNALDQTCKQKGITEKDLYTAHFNDKGQLTYLEVNSILVNSICADTAQILSNDLNKMSSRAVNLPIGVLTGFNIFSHLGPHIPIYLTPSGSAKADYETSVEGAGIGQVNFKVWLVVNTEMGIVNPLINKRITVTRKVMLINALFAGEVPEAFYGERN